MEMLGVKKWILDIARQKETAETEVQSTREFRRPPAARRSVSIPSG